MTADVGLPAGPSPFDPCGSLPTGLTLLEASAGTGKTFTIASLVARYVAEGVELERLLVVSFTRMATGELRARVRERLLQMAEGLARELVGTPDASGDDLVSFLGRGAPQVVEERRARLEHALRNFDAATIETTHGFCLRVLGELGVAASPGRDVTLVEDADDLLEAIVDDLYVRRFYDAATEPLISRGEALVVARAIVANPSATLAPARTDGQTSQAMRRRLADAVLTELDRRKRATGILTYDDVLLRLAGVLGDAVWGEVTRQRLRERYSVVLVDEFQDTDPVQWEILRRAFRGSDTTLVLIGDPKQAIYAFRGADIRAYLDAASDADTRATLATNWRSDRCLLDAYDLLFAPASLGDQRIAYHRVSAARRNADPRLVSTPITSPLRLRVLERSQVTRTGTGFAEAPAARAFIARDLAGDVVKLLSSEARVLERGPDDTVIGEERIRPGHLAVLVPWNSQAEAVRAALAGVGVPAVTAGGGSVFSTQAAKEWRALLGALEQPSSPSRAAGAAITCFVGWDPASLATATERELDALHEQLHRWSGLLARLGVAALVEHVSSAGELPARVLGDIGGERLITDLRHVGELLHGAAATSGTGAAALGAWLRRRIADAAAGADTEDRVRRLDSDAEAVQVLTIHRSKGLEFPIVYLPFAWDHRTAKSQVPVFHDAVTGRRTVDVAGKGADYVRHQDIEVDEEQGEALRLLYVALTRARHQAVVWWAGSYGSGDSALGRILFAKDAEGQMPTRGLKAPSDTDARARLDQLAVDSDGLISCERAVGDSAPWTPPPEPEPELGVASFDRSLDRDWRRTSYTAITLFAHDEVTGEDDAVLADEVGEPAIGWKGDASEEEDLRAAELLLAGMPGGVSVGTLVHRVLETIDFSEADLESTLRSRIAAEAIVQGVRLQADEVAAGLAAALRAPLGFVLEGAALIDIGPRDRLDELAFELPLAGGDVVTCDLAVADIGKVLRDTLAPEEPLFYYATRLEEPEVARQLRGYLTGSLDLVVRLPDGRYAIADYKTNRLARSEEPLTAWHYRPRALLETMDRAHYYLQAILYLVALHRYLRWRLPDYEPKRHIAGVLYLFLRGMSAPKPLTTAAGEALGVWAFRPPVSLIEGLSDLFDRGEHEGD